MADSKKYDGSQWEHSLRKLTTDTDIITTLPADIYANDTTATVGLKGQMSQSSTPTPTNPIQPSECGDLETSGAKAGQYKIPISSANTTTPVYLGEVETTRRIRKLVLTGEEAWFINEVVSTEDTVYLYSKAIASNTYVPEYSICSHFEYKDAYGIYNENGFQLLSGYGGLRIRIMRTIAGTVAGFKTYLQQQYAAGTPVIVWYVLAEPTTGIVNEPLRKIGDYADTISGISIPTITGKDTFDVETTLKPSEVELAYTGWHDATVKEWDGSQWNE